MALSAPNTAKVNGTFILVAAITVFLSFFLHELCHYFAGILQGLPMGMSLNNTFGLGNPEVPVSQAIIICAAGPVFTILQAVIVYFLIQRNGSPLLYPALFTPFYMRLLAGVMNVFNLNDEGKIGNFLGIGTYTLSAVVVGFLFYLVYITSSRQHYPARFNGLTLFLVLLFSSILILCDQFFKVRVL